LDVYKKGRCVHQKEEKLAYPSTKPSFPTYFYDSIQCKILSGGTDLQIQVEGKFTILFICKCIQIQKWVLLLRHVQREVPGKKLGLLDWENKWTFLIYCHGTGMVKMAISVMD